MDLSIADIAKTTLQTSVCSHLHMYSLIAIYCTYYGVGRVAGEGGQPEEDYIFHKDIDSSVVPSLTLSDRNEYS